MLLSDARKSFNRTIALRKPGSVESWLLDTFNIVKFGNLGRYSGRLGIILFETLREDIDGHSLLKFGMAVSPIDDRFALSRGFSNSIWSRIRRFADHMLLETDPIASDVQCCCLIDASVAHNLMFIETKVKKLTNFAFQNWHIIVLSFWRSPQLSSPEIR